MIWVFGDSQRVEVPRTCARTAAESGKVVEGLRAVHVCDVEDEDEQNP